MNKFRLLVAMAILVVGIGIQRADATAAMNSCNTYNECRANIVTVYAVGSTAYVVLQGHLIPAICTNAAWGYYWALNLNEQAQRAWYATLLAAYLSGQPAELKSDDAACNVSRLGLGEA